MTTSPERRSPTTSAGPRLALVASLSLWLASTAHADAIPPPPRWQCFPGTRLALGHAGESCIPTDCSREGTNGVCPEGLVCAEAVALFPEPSSPPPFPEMRPVAADCTCDATRCVRARWCVPPDAEIYACPPHATPPVRGDQAGAASCAASPVRGAPALALIAASRRRPR